jgi:3-deoxy-7-phosphoheptulonate synthase
MIIQLENRISQSTLDTLIAFLDSVNIHPRHVKTRHHSYLVAPGGKDIDLRKIGLQEGVRDVFYVGDEYQLVSRAWKVHHTCIRIGEIPLGEHAFQLILGPCSVESEEQIRKIASYLSEKGVRLIRGGVFKPRSSPYSFQGLGMEGLRMLHSIAMEYGLKIITEVMQEEQIEDMYPFVDVFQVGTRNSQNFALLKALGKVEKPVLLKRGMSMTLNEFMQAAEYIFMHGNEDIILCERGIRSFETAYRNTLDLNAVPWLKEKSHLPVIVDPSHGTGNRKWVIPMSFAAVMAGADGLLIEIHPVPEKAKSDGIQSLNFTQTDELIEGITRLLPVREKLFGE